MKRMVVTSAEYAKAEHVFRAAEADGFQCVPAEADEGELAAAVSAHGAAGAVIGVLPYRDALYAALPRGAVLARFGVGHDGVDKARATAAGVLCTNTPGVLTDSVAEHTLGLILAAARRLPENIRSASAETWAPEVGHELRGKTLAVIGVGAIGRRVAEIASFGFRMRVVGCEVAPVDVDEARRRHGFEAITTDFAGAVAEADFVSLHVPGADATRGFIDAARLAQMPASAWLINTSRGTVVDEVALFQSLRSGRLAGAALDVFEHEPYAPAAPGADLGGLGNVIRTPHVGSSTHEACERMARRALHNIRLAEDGRYAEMDLVNPDVLTVLGVAGTWT